MAIKYEQPAIKSYFFDKGYKDLSNIIKKAWENNAKTASKFGEGLSDTWQWDTNWKILVCIYYIVATISMYVFGTIFFSVIALIHVSILMIFMFFIYFAFSLAWLADRLFLMRRKISVSCYECHNKFLFPIYVCPTCGAEHDRLTPSVYGIFYRECQCHTKLPTSFLNIKSKRKDLKAVCPECNKNAKTTPLTDGESRPICIPVVGGASVGKTAFITAFANQFIEEIAPSKNFTVKEYNDDIKSEYTLKRSDYARGSVKKTPKVTDRNKASSIAFSFFLQHKKLHPERLIHIYDIAGETFTENDENELQKQYDYCHGIIFMIDPFSIPIVRRQYESEMNSVDSASISEAQIDFIMENFLVKLKETTGLSQTQIMKTPIAIVINKVDILGIKKLLGKDAIRKKMHDNPEKFSEYYNTMDYLCKEFLIKNNMADVINHINKKFSKNRFFACSSMGHSLNKGRYYPEEVLPVVEWIISLEDRTIKNIWNETSFPDKTIEYKI